MRFNEKRLTLGLTRPARAAFQQTGEEDDER